MSIHEGYYRLHELADELRVAADAALAGDAAKAIPETPEGWEQLLDLFDAVDAIKAAAGELVAQVAPEVVKRAPNTRKTYATPAGHVVKFTGGTAKHTYDHDRLVSAAAAKLVEVKHLQTVVDTDGQARPAREVVDELVRQVTDLVVTPSFAGWRQKAADRIGLELAQYRTTEHTPYTPKVDR